MRIIITGMDGYLGWPLYLYLKSRGHEVVGIDNRLRRKLVDDVGSISAIPIDDRPTCKFYGNLTHYDWVRGVYNSFQPEAIVYLGEIPSAPYSMIGFEEARFTQENNITGTLATLYAMREVCPDAHLIKLGSMGEYGTPNCSIPEGTFPPGAIWNQHGSLENIDGMMFPRQAGSWYHQSKVHDTHNVEMACRVWGLRSTDVMQGVVYGSQIPEMDNDPKLATRFDFDECFGTVINRFCAQATIDHPLTVYGSGKQVRGFLPLKDSMQCLGLLVENPPEQGEYRTVNQFAESYSVHTLAKIVCGCFLKQFSKRLKIQHLENPRVEKEEHVYNVTHQKLRDLGYVPTGDIEQEITTILRDLQPHSQRIEDHQKVLTPKIQWKPTL